jgi:hypothetical protein
MKILSTNVKGLGGHAKQLSLKRLINLERLEIILLQETMGMGEPLIFYLKNLLGGWDFIALDVEGLSGGVNQMELHHGFNKFIFCYFRFSD